MIQPIHPLASNALRVARILAVASLLSLLVSCTDDEPSEPDDGLESLGESGWLMHVNARSEADIFVVGGTPDDGFLSHFDGDSWNSESLPDQTRLLNWIHLFDDGSAVAVGNAGTILESSDGSAFEAAQALTTEDLWGVWGHSPEDVWAVGGRGRAESEPVILRRVDGTWETFDLPTLERPGVRALFKVWGASEDAVFVVGQNGIILHWDSETWTEFGAGTSEDLISLEGTSADNVYAVGGRGNGVIAHFDGTEWVSHSMAPAPGLNGITLTDDHRGWVAGVNGTLREMTHQPPDAPEIERTAPVSSLDLHALDWIPGYGILAVGGNFSFAQGPYEGIATRRTP